jgi:hypothetical protein
MSKVMTIEADVTVKSLIKAEVHSTPMVVPLPDAVAGPLAQAFAVGDTMDADGGVIDGDLDIEINARVPGRRILVINLPDTVIEIDLALAVADAE